MKYRFSAQGYSVSDFLYDSLTLKEKYPEIPWRKMYGLRNLISHEYFGIDYEMIWEISKNNLPQNRADLQRIIEKEK